MKLIQVLHSSFCTCFTCLGKFQKVGVKMLVSFLFLIPVLLDEGEQTEA